MFRVDSTAHGGYGNAYTGSSGSGKENSMCGLSISQSIHLSLARGKRGRNKMKI